MKAQMPIAVDWYSSLLKPNQVYCSLWLIKQSLSLCLNVFLSIKFIELQGFSRLGSCSSPKHRFILFSYYYHPQFSKTKTKTKTLSSPSLPSFPRKYCDKILCHHIMCHHICHHIMWQKTLSSPSLPSFPRKHCDKLATLVATGVSGRSRQTPSVSTKNISNLYILDISGKYLKGK